MIKRIFDIFVALIAILLTFPLWVLAFIGVKLSDPKGPIFYLTKRVGLNSEVFVMYKFRTMRWCPDDTGAAITGKNDNRIFGFGSFLRKSKIDELPQFLNVLKGDISIVGPRPEDPKIVDLHYTDWMKETLNVRPGITSPGALWGYTKAEEFLTGDNPEKDYVDHVLPLKLALEYVYVKKQSITYDFSLILRTALIVVMVVMGKTSFKNMPEIQDIPDSLGVKTQA